MLSRCCPRRYKKCPLAGVLPRGAELGTFIRKEDAERLIEEVGGDEPEIAVKLRIEEHELEAGGLN